MGEALQNFDAQLFLALNGAHSTYLDGLMWNLSSKWAWVPVMVMLLVVLLRQGWKQALLAVVAIGLAVLMADQVASGLIKPLVERLRPTHNPTLAMQVHVVADYRGGTYGFVSSHAANMMALAVLLCLMVRWRALWCVAVPWALLVSYSRIYLGVHYPGDVLCGALVGVVAGCAAWWLWRWCRKRCWPWLHGPLLADGEARMLNFSLLANLLIIAAIAPWVMLPR